MSSNSENENENSYAIVSVLHDTKYMFDCLKLVYSIKLHSSLCDCVLIYDCELNDDEYNQLLLFWDLIIEVDSIRYKFNQIKQRELNIIYCLELKDIYSAIIYVDPIATCIACPDVAFSMKHSGIIASFLSNWKKTMNQNFMTPITHELMTNSDKVFTKGFLYLVVNEIDIDDFIEQLKTQENDQYDEFQVFVQNYWSGLLCLDPGWYLMDNNHDNVNKFNLNPIFVTCISNIDHSDTIIKILKKNGYYRDIDVANSVVKELINDTFELILSNHNSHQNDSQKEVDKEK
eukprot:TRINITY_DN3279_c8_g1_i1.p1 TRINITY_DN3279_c8_g1~~TRINITY_DN3279_c8_g1_i1.p1  ORF type:complete len:289 (+),score=75.32 TRINITY_DN3279_c8_g1_i1:40-906(+)